MKFSKLTAILLLFSMLLTCFVACQKEDTNAEPPASNGGNATQLELIKDGQVHFRILIAKNRPPMTESCGETIAEAINQKYGTALTVEDDMDPNDPFNKELVQNDAIEILIGSTNRVESQGMTDLLPTDTSWLVKVVDKKIVIVATDATCYQQAAAFFLESIVETASATTLAVANGLDHRFDRHQSNPLWAELLANDWLIYYKGSATQRIEDSAKALGEALSQSLNKTVSTITGAAPTGHYINFALDDSLGFYNYKITHENGAFELRGGSNASLAAAGDNFVEHILDGDMVNGEYYHDFDYTLFNPLASDPSSFVPVWKDTITVPAWMTDLEEKMAALFDANGRPLLLSHSRAGYTYPENTVEDTISNIMLGADILEMDVYHTKDNVIIMSHNSFLPKESNYLEFKGKNGYPNSDYFADWTFAQLKDLDITWTHDDGTVVKYKICSLYEILTLTRGRCFLMLDKKDAWITTEDVLELAVETNSCEVFLYSMFLNRESGYASNDVAMKFYPSYLAENASNTYQKQWYDTFMKYYNAAGGEYPRRKWALEEGTSATGKEKETFADYQRVVDQFGSHVIIWTNEVNLSSTFISRYYTASQKK